MSSRGRVSVGAAVLLATVWGCGETVFIDPDGPRKAELVLLEARRFKISDDPRSYFFLRIGTTGRVDDVRLSLVGPAGAVELTDQGRDVGVCKGGTCLSYTVGPGLPEDLELVILEVPEIGHRTTRPLDTEALGGYGLSASALAGNTGLEVQVADPIRFRLLESELLDDGRKVLLFPRRFDRWVAPRPCGTPPLGTEPGWAATDRIPFRTDATFSAPPEAQACLAVRPSWPPSGPAVALTSVPARALVDRYTHLYAPPRERAPLVYQIIFDLELPSEARCVAAKDLIEGAVRDSATTIAADLDLGAEILGLPSVDLAVTGGVPCRQFNERSLYSPGVAAAIVGAVQARFGTTRAARVVVLYATNLNLPLPDGLRQELAGLESFFPEPYRLFTIFISPELPAQGAQLDRRFEWTSTQEPSFRNTIANALSDVWPFTSMVHRDDTFVPLVEAGAAEQYRAYRLCSADQPVRLEGQPYPGGDGQTLQIGPLGPGYRVSLPPQLLAPRTEYTPVTIRTVWEGCRDLCDRPAPGNLQNTPWSRSQNCP